MSSIILPSEKRIIIPDQLHRAQMDIYRDDTRFKVVAAGRRFGKTHLLRSILRREATRKQRANVWYVAPTYGMAREIMWDALKQAIPDEWVRKYNETLLKCYLINGSTISLKGADRPDTLRGVGLDFVGLDEYQDFRPFVWEQVLRPTLATTQGSAMFIGCVKGDTWVLPEAGMTRIDEFSKGSPDKTLDSISQKFYGIDRSFHEADGFWNNGIVPTKRIVTHLGFELEASYPHPVWVMTRSGDGAWKSMKDVKPGDRLAIDRGMEIWGDADPTSGWDDHVEKWRAAFVGKRGRKLSSIQVSGMSVDLAYFLGLWLAEGSVEESTGRITITCGDASVGDFLKSGRVLGLKFKSVKGRNDQWRVNSYELLEFMRFIGMPICKAPSKEIPTWVVRGSREWAKHFVSGMWDGDGTCIRGAKLVAYATSSKKMASQLQLLLTNFGIISRLTQHTTPPTQRVNKASVGYRVVIQGRNVDHFLNTFDLRIERKSEVLEEYARTEWSRRDGIPNQGERISKLVGGNASLAASDYACIYSDSDVSYKTAIDLLEKTSDHSESEARKSLQRLVEQGYYWDEVTEVQDSEARTYDFTIPDTHSFWSNGFISHNTPKSFNHLYDLYQKGMKQRNRKRPEWKSWQFPTITSPFVPYAEIEQARRDLDPRTFRQEFEASFETMSGRVYYPFNRRTHVGQFPFNPKLPIWVGQDFNINPMSAAIMQPQPNGEVWVVDEIVLYNSNVSEVCDVMDQKYWRYQDQITIFPDPAGGSRQHARGESALDIFRERGFRRILNHKKHPFVQDRINSVNSMLFSADGTIRLRVDEHCRNVIEGFEQVIYKTDTNDVDKSLNKEHVLDGLGYCIEYNFPTRKVVVLGVNI